MITKLEIGWFRELPPAEDIVDYEDYLHLDKPKPIKKEQTQEQVIPNNAFTFNM